MMAITLRNPPALWVELGWKTIETRSRPTSYRGSLIITAASKWLDVMRCPDGGVCHHGSICGARRGCYRMGCCAPLSSTGWTGWPAIPSGVIVAVAQLDECAAIHVSRSGRAVVERGSAHVVVNQGTGRANYYRADIAAGEPAVDVSDQLSWGDFVDGYFGYMLGDVRVLDVPIPMRGSQGSPLFSPPRDVVDQLHALGIE